MRRSRQVVLSAVMAAMMLVFKYALDGLPNIELVSLLIIVYTLEFPALAPGAIYAYVLIYGLLNGFGLWWFPQLYVWLVLYGVVRLFHTAESPLFWACVSAIFGLSYGALYALSYSVMNGPAMGFAWWVSGLPFDALHCGGNFLCALLLLRPLRRVMRQCGARCR